MKVQNIKDFYRGWFIGDFEPSILKTDKFEIAVLNHARGEIWPKHYHAVATEYNVLLEGHMTVCGVELFKNDVFTIYPNEVADPIFHEDCRILCVKVPSLRGDKYETI